MIELISTYQADLVVNYYPFFRKVIGHNADVYFPIEKPSIYRAMDDNHEYGDTPDLTGRFIFINIAAYNVGRIPPFYDNFLTDDPHMLVEQNINIPNDSKVVINTSKGRKEYTTNVTLGFRSSKDTIVYKISLNPRSF